MGELGLNKILGAVLATVLALFALHELSGIVFSDGGGHGGDDHAEEMTMSEKFCSKFAYCTDIAETGAVGQAEEVFDLGLALVNANLDKGELSFKGKCASCHTVEQGGAPSTGPNLYNIVGNDMAKVPGFNYSGGLSSYGESWTYANLNQWLDSPSKMVSGTSMSLTGIPRDDERANIIAYLASYSDSPPPFPEPLAVEGASDATEGEDGAADVSENAIETEGTDATPVEPTASDSIDGAVPNSGTEIQQDAALDVPAEIIETAEDVIETAGDAAADATNAVVEAAGDAANTVEGVVEDAVDAVEDSMEAPDQRAFDHAEGTDVDAPADPDTTEEQ